MANAPFAKRDAFELARDDPGANNPCLDVSLEVVFAKEGRQVRARGFL